MKFGLYQFFMIAVWLVLVAVVIYVVYLIIKALRKYTKSASDPSTTNLMALAKLFGVSEDLLKETK